MQRQAPKNLSELANRMSEVFNNLESGVLEVKTASEMSNAAGKIIKIAALQLTAMQLKDSQVNNKLLA